MVRPRVFSFSIEEMIELGKEMVDYVKANKSTILHLSEWYTIEKGYTYNSNHHDHNQKWTQNQKQQKEQGQ